MKFLISKCFTAVVENKAVSAELAEMARYRLGKCQEKLGNIEAAIDIYLAYIVYQYVYELDAERKVRDWFYFARAGYDAAVLLVARDRFREAARVYEKLAETGIPTAADAQQKAKEIRDAHKLND